LSHSCDGVEILRFESVPDTGGNPVESLGMVLVEAFDCRDGSGLARDATQPQK